jgi:hypothetical protein
MIRTALSVVCSCLAVGLFAVDSKATFIQSDPNGMAFQAKDASASSGFYEVLNTGTEINSVVYTPPATGFGGSVMWVAGQQVGTGAEVDTDLTNGVQSYAEYSVQFSSTGTYRVWWAGQRTSETQQLGEGSTVGGNDSIWIGGLNANHNSTSGFTSHTIVGGGISYRDTGVLWVIDGSNVNTPLTFTLGLREDGPIYDRIAFTLEGSGTTPGSLTVIPEPISAALLLIGAIAGVGIWRRR